MAYSKEINKETYTKRWIMKKLFLTVLITILLPFNQYAIAAKEENIQAAFIRDGNLWLLKNSKEEQITQTGHIYNPQWSHDGKWLLFQKEAPSQFEDNKIQNEIWVYNLQTGEKKRIFNNGYRPQWSPNRNLVAFQDNGVLNVSDLTEFHNIALGVYSFTWLPDGESFLLSSQANLNPDGWTSPVLYKKDLPKNLAEVDMFGNVNEFFVVPKDLRVNNKNVMSINVNSFRASPSKKWISFIVSPTASLSMDSNMLCAISIDGKKFETLDEIIYGVGAPKWAPSKDILAYIAGGGRIVFGFKGKDLKYKEFPVSSSLTPTNFAELNFTWVDNNTIVTSRVEAKEWSNELSEHPLPSLYAINIHNGKQVKISDATNGLGDYDPHYLRSVGKLIWYRGTSITDQNRNVWMADADGSNSKLWLKNVDSVVFYEGE
jgi:dipeptidyl aminopeptidase/acylaminoacyl peptidase